MTSELDRPELLWPNKETEVNPPILPFQTIETVNEPRISEKPFDFETTNYPQNWKDKLIWGDNKYILSSLKSNYEGLIDLIYIDPPFATGADFSVSIDIGDKSVTKEPSVIEELAYRDTWGKQLQSYLQMMYDRTVLMKELLSDKATIYVHLDWHVGHYVKLIMDEIFGQDNFRNEIIWCYNKWTAPSNDFQKNHDVLLRYSKSDEYTFNVLREIDEKRQKTLDRGYTTNLLSNGDRQLIVYKGKENQENIKKLIKSDKFDRVLYKEPEGNPLKDYWELNILHPKAIERVGFPTQKPETLIKRIIRASSNKGDLVADFFCGSGTTGAVAEKLGRKWIMSDLSKFAIQTTRKRLLNIHNYSKEYDKPARPFEIWNLGNYQKYKFTENGHPPVKEYQDFIVNLYEAVSIEGYSFLHGRKGSTFVHIASVDGIVTEDEVKHATEECRNAAGGNKLDILGWDFEMGLDRMVGQIGEMYGVDINLKVIPKEAAEIKKATEKRDHIKFFDLNYLKLNHTVTGSKLEIELMDFVLANPEYIPEEARESIESFTDYIDYWAVDFDYQDDTFHNMWQTFRTRDRKQLETKCEHDYENSGSKNVLVKVIDIFGNDTNKLLEVNING